MGIFKVTQIDEKGHLIREEKLNRNKKRFDIGDTTIEVSPSSNTVWLNPEDDDIIQQKFSKVPEKRVYCINFINQFLETPPKIIVERIK